MKRILISIFLYCCIPVFAEYTPVFPNWLEYGAMKEQKKYIIWSDPDWTEFEISDIKFGNDGYMRISFLGIDYIAIYGGNHLYFFEEHENKTNMMIICTTGFIIDTFSFDELFQRYKTIPEEKEVYGREFPLWDIKKITASSAYSEISKGKSITYVPGNLNKFVCFDNRGAYWFKNHMPWVEGKKDAGIGERLTITFDKPVDSILILNGFVDLSRRQLYKANNRIKKAIVRSKEFEIEYEFEDVVKLSEIKFPEKTEEIELIIKEVYKGERWDDTVVTAIMRNYVFLEDGLQYDQFSRIKKLYIELELTN